MSIIRWIAILPGAILAAAIVAFPIHIVVMFTFAGWGHDPIIEINNYSTLHAIELFLLAKGV
jgi:ABC-type sugar transport system permease subunit